MTAEPGSHSWTWPNPSSTRMATFHSSIGPHTKGANFAFIWSDTGTATTLPLAFRRTSWTYCGSRRSLCASHCRPEGLKEVEKFVGFERQLPGGWEWAIAQYLRAVETGEETIVAEILGYNEEDLDATWAVYRWLAEVK